MPPIQDGTWPDAMSEMFIDAIKGVAHAHPAPVEKYAHVAFTHAEKSANLLGLKFLLTAQDEHGALCRWERINGRFDMFKDHAALNMSVWGQLIPELGHVAPVTASVKRVCKAVTITGIVEEDNATLALGEGPGLVDQNGVDPACQRASSLEKIDPAKDRQPCILNDFFGHVPGLDDTGSETDHRRIVASKQALEGCLIPFEQTSQQILLANLRVPHQLSNRCPQAANRTIVLKVQRDLGRSSHCDAELGSISSNTSQMSHDSLRQSIPGMPIILRQRIDTASFGSSVYDWSLNDV